MDSERRPEGLLWPQYRTFWSLAENWNCNFWLLEGILKTKEPAHCLPGRHNAF